LKLSFKFCNGYRYIGGFLGTDDALEKWLEPQIQQWVEGMEALAKAARWYPQSAYAGMMLLLQHE
jgi:hypothetical protein